MASNDAFAQALQSNKKWIEDTKSTQPDLFPSLAKGQQPSILWLGCSDSRVPESTILSLPPGRVFVHRNIANILPPTDLSSLSVIQYAVQYLKVSHIVVCGHTSCGGCAAALGNAKLGLIDAWLQPLRKLRAENAREWEGLSSEERGVKLVEANVKMGVKTVRENPDVIDGVRERGVQVHGAVFEVGSGVVRELDCGDGEEEGKRREECFAIKA